MRELTSFPIPSVSFRFSDNYDDTKKEGSIERPSRRGLAQADGKWAPNGGGGPIGWARLFLFFVFFYFIFGS